MTDKQMKGISLAMELKERLDKTIDGFMKEKKCITSEMVCDGLAASLSTALTAGKTLESAEGMLQVEIGFIKSVLVDYYRLKKQ